MEKIRTVLGDISSGSFGLALAHEHIMCDFVGADKITKDRYDPKEVFDTMLPHMIELRELEVKGFVDCTPVYLGRDVQLLSELSKASGLHIVTNTGLYKEPYLPRYAFEYSTKQLADIWLREIENGIDGTPVKAGFIKIAVNPGPIIPIQQKIVRAAAQCSLSTGAVIACHTTSGIAAMQLMQIIEDEGCNLERLIVVHCDAEEDIKYHLEIGHQGAWIEYDGLRKENSEKILDLIKIVVDKGFGDQLLLSQDAGWYNVGEKGGGNILSYSYLPKDFIPMMMEKGLGKELINKILIKNVSTAFKMK